MCINAAETEGEVFDFAAYGLNAARRFLKTAIVIDDEITIPDDGLDAVPDVIMAPPFAAATAAIPTVEKAIAEPKKDPPAEVAIKPLADAFLDKKIVCGVLKPDAADNVDRVVARAVQASEVADIVILDWFLRPADNGLALSVLKEILNEDGEQNGRLRLVVVYTSAAPLDQRCEELKIYLEKAGFQCSTPDDDILLVANCRIRFAMKFDGKSGVPVEELPELAIDEFAKHSNGLLSNFALLGIAALREATHHLLAVLDRRLDPAFVGHRMMVGDAEDAHGFALSLFMMQIKSVLSLPHHLGNSLGDGEINAWVDDRFAIDNVEEKLTELKAPLKFLKSEIFSQSVKGKAAIPYSALFLPDAERLGQEIADLESQVSRDFARLATFVREFEGHHPLPEDWQPTLTLGSMVRLEGDRPKYLLCLQPSCDTVRIDGSRFFPFIELDRSGSNVDNLVVRGGAESSIRGVNGQPGGRHYAEFRADDNKKCILASRVSKEGKTVSFVFESTANGQYTWLGDISPMKAQRIAVELAGTSARVGIDEYDWLRRGGKA